MFKAQLIFAILVCDVMICLPLPFISSSLLSPISHQSAFIDTSVIFYHCYNVANMLISNMASPSKFLPVENSINAKYANPWDFWCKIFHKLKICVSGSMDFFAQAMRLLRARNSWADIIPPLFVRRETVEIVRTTEAAVHYEAAVLLRRCLGGLHQASFQK